VENVYTQHTPLLVQTLEALVRGRLKDLDYPFIDRGRPATTPPAGKAPRLVLIFIVGGTTYAEARAVAELNAAGARQEGWPASITFLLGGTEVLNSRAFLTDLSEVATGQRQSIQ
jgi:vacuolar protein sorting-associated protein 45